MFNHYSNDNYKSFVLNFATIFIDLDESLKHIKCCQVAIFENKNMTLSKQFNITNECEFNEALSEILDIIGERPIVIYNAKFIQEIIYQESNKKNLDRMKNMTWICPCEMYFVREPSTEVNHSLKGVIRKYNVKEYFNIMFQEEINGGDEPIEVNAIYVGIVFIILVGTMSDYEYSAVSIYPEFCGKRITFLGNEQRYNKTYLEYLASRAGMYIMPNPLSIKDIDFVVTESWTNNVNDIYFLEEINKYNNSSDRYIDVLTEYRFAKIINSEIIKKQ